MDMPFEPGPDGTKCEAIDVDAELRRWQVDSRSPAAAHRAGFPRFEPTFKFAYDLYLQWHREPLDALGGHIEGAYERQLPPAQRLDRETVHAIVAAVWERMGGRLHACRMPATALARRGWSPTAPRQAPPAV